MRTWIIAIVALVVGAAIGYFYEKNQADALSERVAEVEAQIEQEMAKTEDAGAQIETLKAEVAEKAKEIEQHLATISDLRANQSETPPAAEQPAAEEPAAQ